MPGKGIHEFNVITKSKQKITVYKNNSYNGGSVAGGGGNANLLAATGTPGTGTAAQVLVCSTVGEWSLEIDKIERGDKSVRSGGRTNPFDFDIELPACNFNDVKYMHDWAMMALDASRFTRGDAYEGVDADAYRTVMREYMPHIKEGATNTDVMKASALDVWVSSEKLPDYALDSNDEAMVTYSCSASGIFYEDSKVFATAAANIA
jgi:hypothetical protein